MTPGFTPNPAFHELLLQSENNDLNSPLFVPKPAICVSEIVQFEESLSERIAADSSGSQQLLSMPCAPWQPATILNLPTATLHSQIDSASCNLDSCTEMGQSLFEIRKSNHKVAEQRRRDAIKQCFDGLRSILPNLTEKIPSRLHILEKTLLYLNQLEKENQALRRR